MAVSANLDFEIAGVDEIKLYTLDEMLDKIVERRKEYEELSGKAKDRCKNFTTTMAVNFVLQSSKAVSCDNTCKHDGTHLVLKECLESEGENCTESSEVDKKYINIYRALRQSFYGQSGDDEWSELRGTGLLTVNVVCDLHATLVKGLKLSSDGGNIRKRENQRGDVGADYKGKTHTYPPPEVLEGSFYGIIDRHNIHMEGRKNEGISRKQTIYVFKCAAWLLFELVSLHPFYDGNGRLCRLLANYVLSLITPFPVSIYNTSSPDRNRDNYLDAIVHGREKNHGEGMGKLASMLVEGAYHGWEDLFQYLKVGGLLSSKQLAGSIVVRKSRNEIEDKVKRFCQLKNISQIGDILSDVKSAVASVDTSGMTEPDQYILKELDIKHDDNVMMLQIEVYY